MPSYGATPFNQLSFFVALIKLMVVSITTDGSLSNAMCNLEIAAEGVRQLNLPRRAALRLEDPR